MELLSVYHSCMTSPSQDHSYPVPASKPPALHVRSGNRQVLGDLKLYGPGSAPRQRSLAECQAYCSALTRLHYENFSVASWLVPRELRQHLANIYAYCRWSDDLADETGDSNVATSLLAWWRGQLEQCYRGQTVHPVFVALSQTIEKYELSKELFSKLLDAFLQDQTTKRYESFEQLREYCRGSADPVGRILLAMCNINDPESLRQSDSVCTGLQIANFCQDMRIDSLRDRIYMPMEIWSKFDVDEAMILSARPNEKLKKALRHWCHCSHQHLADGLLLVRTVPPWLARDLQLFVRGGLRILEEIRRSDYDVWSREIEVSRNTKLSLLFRASLFPRSIRVPTLE